MGDRVQLDYVLLDVGFLHKPKIIALRSRYGHVAALYLIDILSSLSIATNAEMDIFAAYGLANSFEIAKNEAKEIVDYCVKNGILEQEDEVLTQRRVAEDQEKLANARKRKQEAQAAYREKKEATEKSLRELRDSLQDNLGEIKKTSTPVTVTPTDTVTDTEYNNKSEPWKTNLRAGDPLSKYFAQSDPYFEKPTGQAWTRKTGFINLGRMPLKKYPMLWMTPRTLAECFQLYDQKGIHRSEWHRAIKKVNSKVESDSLKPGNYSSDTYDAGEALRSWALDWLMESLTKEARLKKSEGRELGKAAEAVSDIHKRATIDPRLKNKIPALKSLLGGAA